MNGDDAERMQRLRIRSGRMEAFSDGVFAIAITLLVLEIAVGDNDDLLAAVLAEWPSYFAYAVSFATIGAVWVGHTLLTEFLGHVSAVFLRLNLVLLLFIGFLPFPTHLVAEHLGSPDAERVAVTLYGVLLLAIVLSLSGLWRRALRDGLVRTDRDQAEVELLTRRFTPGLASYLVFIVVGLFLPTVSVLGYMVIAIGLLIPRRHRRR